MATYTVGAAAVALGVSRKWLDNALSHQHVPGVTHTRRGVSRRIGSEALVRIRIALELTSALKTSLHHALQLADSIVQERAGERAMDLSPAVVLKVDVALLRSGLLRDLATAVEITPSPRRGRQPRARPKSKKPEPLAGAPAQPAGTK